MQRQPIFITGVERSGASIIARLVATTDQVWFGDVSARYIHKEIVKQIQLYLLSHSMDPAGQYPVPQQPLAVQKTLPIIVNRVLSSLSSDTKVWALKNSLFLHTWRSWVHHYPEARWIFVRRKPGDVIRSCMRTGYMHAYHFKSVQKLVNVQNEQDGWKWWVDWGESQMNSIINAGVDHRIIYPDRLEMGDYSQAAEMLTWLGLDWNERIIPCVAKLFKTPKR